jgi:hypothetical protein
MYKKFSNWMRWHERNKLGGAMKYPGVYVIALSEKDIASTPFKWCQNIIYIGMTNSKGGLKSRLQQFENTIKGMEGHGGAARVRFKHRDYSALVSTMFVSVSHTECDVTSNKPSDLRLMGKVVQQEYECLAIFVEMFKKGLPEFNDKKKSPKKLSAVPPRKRVEAHAGSLQGKIWMSPDFDAPLDDFKNY